jgi:hypothetical protein
MAAYFPGHRMAANVVKKRIVTGFGAADYTGPLNTSGQPHGLGSFEVVGSKNKGFFYEGQFNSGSREGFGKESKDGDVWQGEYKENNVNGFIKVLFFKCDLTHSLQWTGPTGDVSEGLYKNGDRNGLATV